MALPSRGAARDDANIAWTHCGEIHSLTPVQIGARGQFAAGADPGLLKAMSHKGSTPGHFVMLDPILSNGGVHLDDLGVVCGPRAFGGADVALGDFKSGHVFIPCKRKRRPGLGGVYSVDV